MINVFGQVPISPKGRGSIEPRIPNEARASLFSTITSHATCLSSPRTVLPKIAEDAEKPKRPRKQSAKAAAKAKADQGDPPKLKGKAKAKAKAGKE